MPPGVAEFTGRTLHWARDSMHHRSCTQYSGGIAPASDSLPHPMGEVGASLRGIWSGTLFRAIRNLPRQKSGSANQSLNFSAELEPRVAFARGTKETHRAIMSIKRKLKLANSLTLDTILGILFLSGGSGFKCLASCGF